MSESKFKTLRHMEAVRNFMTAFAVALLDRAQAHDQSKLQSPEAEIFEEYTPKLRQCSYDSEEYRGYLKEMQVALDHHYAKNRHHPEHFKNGIRDMNLFDIVEMVCDWKAATLRHNDGNILKSLAQNQERFGFSDELKQIMQNTVEVLEQMDVPHHAEES